jgi:membrane associated rhomboid family serine protease
MARRKRASRYLDAVASRFQFALPDPRPRDGWFRFKNLDVTTTALLVIAGVASMFLYAISKSAFVELLFHPIPVRDGDLWRLFTWPLANAPTQIWVVFTLLFFWFVGHAVEELVGRVRFTILIATITVLPAAIVTVLPYAETSTAADFGLGLLGTAMLVVFSAEHPNAPFFFGIPAWVIASVFVGIDVLRLVGDRFWGTLTLMLLVIAMALVMVRQWGFVTRLSFIPRVGGGGGRPNPPRRGPAPPRATARRAKGDRGDRRQRGRVVEGPWSAPTPPRSDADAAVDQMELDALLDKISAGGLDSLSTAEKRRLNELSKRLR